MASGFVLRSLAHFYFSEQESYLCALITYCSQDLPRGVAQDNGAPYARQTSKSQSVEAILRPAAKGKLLPSTVKRIYKPRQAGCT